MEGRKSQKPLSDTRTDVRTVSANVTEKHLPEEYDIMKYITNTAKSSWCNSAHNPEVMKNVIFWCRL